VSFAPLLQPTKESFFCIYGFTFVLRTNHSESGDAIARLYRQFLSPRVADIGVEAIFRSESDGFRWQIAEKTASASDLRSALWGFESALCEAIIRSQRRLIAIHAAVVYSRDSVVLLVGPSGAGKSTLSVALTQRGFALATDDVALIEPQTLHVHPIPRCVHLDQQSLQLLEAEGFQLPEVWKQAPFLAPIDLGSGPTYQCGAELLIYIARPRAKCPNLKRVSQSEMAARTLSETGRGPLTDSETVHVLARVSSSAACFYLVPGSLSETADMVSDLILQQPPTSTRTEHGRSRLTEFGRTSI